MKANYLTKIAASIALPVLSIVSGCNTIQGALEDTAWAAKTISNSIQPKETTEVVRRNNYHFNRNNSRENRTDYKRH